MPLFEKVLIANRGEIAVRVIRTCRELGIATVVVASDADSNALHVRMADEAVAIGGRSATESYLRIDAITDAVRSTGAGAVHPGYGFLSEQAHAAIAVEAAGAVWIGPPPTAIAAMGDKISARAAAVRAGVPIVPGTAGAVRSGDDVRAFAAQPGVGYPVAVKASFGGGGRGMKVVRSADEADELLESARREAAASFGNDECYVERYLTWPRHVEVQVLADDHGNVVAVGERDCSVQRRHQKLVEEAPAPGLDTDMRQAIGAAAVRVCREVGYRNAGTVEMIVQDGSFFFLEMNARLQVEHPVTELVTGLDLVAEQLRVAAGLPLSFGATAPITRGHAIEVRVNAEDPAGGRFLPSPGRIAGMRVPSGPGVRWDGGYEVGDEVSPFYDNLVGKLIVWAPDRDAARARMLRALTELQINGVATTAGVAATIIGHPDFASVTHATRWVEERLAFDDPTALTAPTAQTAEPARGTAGDSGANATGALEDPRYVAPVSRREVEVGGRRYYVPVLQDGPTQADSPASAGATHAPIRSSSAVRTAARATGRVVAPMQGTVTKVLVAAGDAVVLGQTMVVLEAMKMENPLVADRDGTVAEVAVAAGALVGPGDLLVRLS